MACGACRKGRSVKPPTDQKAAPEYSQEDGSITFPEGTEVMQIEGYDTDPENPRRLVSLYPGCDYRIAGVMLKKDGTYGATHMCIGDCPSKNQMVTPEACNACPLKKLTPPTVL